MNLDHVQNNAFPVILLYITGYYSPIFPPGQHPKLENWLVNISDNDASHFPLRSSESGINFKSTDE